MSLKPDNQKFWDLTLRIPEQAKQLLPDNCFVFPGLINAHDHLEFNLFPPLANRRYTDYVEWGHDIHLRNAGVIQQVLEIPLALRLRFGVLKNLLNGVTRVVHHGVHRRLIKDLTDYPVWMNYHYLHAPATEKWWRQKLNIPFKQEVMIHAGEGTSPSVTREIEAVLKWNVLRKPMTVIHALGLTAHQARNFKAVIWCPASNLFLYGQTLNPGRIKDQVTVLFGTDSCVSAPGSLWEQLRTARELNTVSDSELFQMLTYRAHRHFYGQEVLAGDWVLAKKKCADPWDAFFQIDPEDIMMVVIQDQVWMCDESLPAVLRPAPAELIRVGRSGKWVQGKLGAVVRELESCKVSLPLEITSA